MMSATPMCIVHTLAVLSLLAWQKPEELGVPSGPGPAEVDRFHPDRGDAPEPRRGGRVVVHLASRPRSLNYMLESSAVTRQLLHELHEPLIRRDWETWEWRGVLAESFEVSDDGLVWTFRLREGVTWHDGHPLDAEDVRFTWSLWKNPHVNCDRRRYMFDKLGAADVLDQRTVRFTFDAPYFLAASAFDESFTVLPAHVYDLADPDNPDHDADATAEEQAEWVNTNPHNSEWIGLGPYRLESFDAQHVEARRYEDYFDPENGGWVDAIRWRIVPGSEPAMQALLAGELDFLDRVSSEDYFGERTNGETFESRFYTGYFFTPYMGYTAWNVKRPRLADARVRRALGMCFDWDAYIRGFYRGLAFRVTGDQWYPSTTYDRSLAPLPYDLEAARALLAESGWYDRDGDGRVDKDGAPLEVELLMPSGNAVSAAFGQLWQESLDEVGVTLTVSAQEFASLRERVLGRDFDALALGSVLAFESDPEQLWHSRWSEGASSNRSGIADDEIDGLIEALQVELDPAQRTALFHRLQRRIYELQPFLFGVCAPHRFAISRRVRGVQLFALDPGYSIRRWFVTE
jgi:ABC-type transport system substrate-binding protein